MSGRKRSRSHDRNSYDGLLKKIKKLEKKVKKKSRPRLPSTSSESDNNHEELIASENPEEWNFDAAVSAEENRDEVMGAEELDGHSDLEQDILDMLGDDPSSNKIFGDNLHKDIASRWKHILLNGLTKENRGNLLKEYLPPENCSQLKAPLLNLEIKAALNESNNKKDVYSQSRQNQLGTGLAALGQALTIALMNKSENQTVIKPLSDAAKLFCDIHYKESLSRRFAAINTLSKQTRDTVKNTKIDNFLFGSELAEHLKSSKAISKSGMEMRPPMPPTRPAAKTLSAPQAGASTSARRGALNARGTPRSIAAGSRAYPPPLTPRQPPPPPRDRPARQLPRYRSRRH